MGKGVRNKSFLAWQAMNCNTTKRRRYKHRPYKKSAPLMTSAMIAVTQVIDTDTVDDDEAANLIASE